MKLTNEEVQEIVRKAEDEYEMLKDRVHDLYDENKELKQENKVLKSILEMQRKRKYCSKFLKDFQKENGKNVFPDFDEIYKRYDEYKERISKAIEYIKENETTFNVHNVANALGIPSLEFTLEPWKKELLDILKGVDKE